MRISLPLCLSFDVEIVVHTPGQPVTWSAASDTGESGTRGFLPVQLRCVRRPSWSDPGNFRQVVEQSQNALQTSHDTGASAAHTASREMPSNVPALSTGAGSPTAEAQRIDRLQSVRQWVDQAPAAEHQERTAIARQFEQFSSVYNAK